MYEEGIEVGKIIWILILEDFTCPYKSILTLFYLWWGDIKGFWVVKFHGQVNILEREVWGWIEKWRMEVGELIRKMLQ